MMGEEVAIVAIVFGSILTIVFLGIVGSIVKTWIKNKSNPEDITKNKEFLSALRDFKEKTERRIANLEAIVTEEHQIESKSERNTDQKTREKKKEHSSAVEIEMEDESRSGESGKSGNLRNMLNQ